MQYFKLENHIKLFIEATSSKASGGGERFKFLALLGDKILDIVLAEYLEGIGIVNSGEITMKIDEWVNKRTLYEIGKQIGLDKQMQKPISGQTPSKNDLKEAVEAIIGASYKGNDLETVRPIVIDLLEKMRI